MGVITNLKAKAIKPGGKPIPHGVVPGLRLLPGQRDGHGKWELRFTSPITGKRRDAGLGSFPEVGIAEARSKAEEYRRIVATGADPIEVKRQERYKAEAMTFEQAITRRHAEHVRLWSKGYALRWITVMKKYAFPHLGPLPLEAITPANVSTTLRPIWIDKNPTARMVSQIINDVMQWAWGLGMINGNPVPAVLRGMPKLNHKTTRRPSVPWRDVPTFVETHLRNGDDYDVKRLALEFIILTGGRSREIREAQWGEIDFESATWTIPPGRMKSRDWHQVPLSDRAMEILNVMKGRRGRVVFPSIKTGGPMSNAALSELMASFKQPSDTPSLFAVPHGFRASLRNWCSEAGYRRDLSERALSHAVENQVEAAYHRTNLLEERRPMMQQWANFVTGKR